jgi:crotonobetainyl-CoA:carnitine CoA-transferase CaiB-like acyl-CoA transferase
MRLDVEHPVAGRIGQVGAPWKIDGLSLPVRMPPPVLGQHTADVLAEVLGYSPEQVAAVQPD